MDENVLTIEEYLGEGYKPLINFGAWRVAILRWIETTEPEKITYLERHTQTDEVFVLLRGQASLILGGTGSMVVDLQKQAMESGKLYNVKQNSWHSVIMRRDATILIVENQDTTESNSEYYQITELQKREIIGMGNVSENQQR
jgi:ureidoglycolate hydrolase